MPSPKQKLDLKQILDNLTAAKKMLPQLPVAEVAKVMETAQELIEACSAEFSKGTEALQRASDALTKQLSTIKNINPKASPASLNQDLIGKYPYQQGYPQNGNLNSPYTPISPPPAPQQRVDPNTPMADGQIKLEIPIIQHLEDFAGDDFAPHQMDSFGEPTFTLGADGVANTPQASPDIPDIPREIPQAFLPTQDAPTEG